MYGKTDKAIKGTWNVICDVCGFKIKASKSKKRWDGLIVCPEDWEPRHPQDFLKIGKEDQSVPFTRTKPADVFTDVPYIILPSDLPNLKFWPRFNQGITVTGSGVSQWDDASGNNNHLLQAVDGNRPSKEADGSILFDGISQFLKAIFALDQPCTTYFLGKQITWTINDYIFDGNLTSSGALRQSGSSSKIRLVANQSADLNDNWKLNTYNIIISTFNGVNSKLQVDYNFPIGGDCGGIDPEGFTLGARGDFISQFGNIQVKEIITYAGIHDAATKTQVINYLATIGDLSI